MKFLPLMGRVAHIGRILIGGLSPGPRRALLLSVGILPGGILPQRGCLPRPILLRHILRENVLLEHILTGSILLRHILRGSGILRLRGVFSGSGGLLLRERRDLPLGLPAV